MENLLNGKEDLSFLIKMYSFSYEGKKYNVSNLSPSLIQKDFPEVKKVTEAANNIKNNRN